MEKRRKAKGRYRNTAYWVNRTAILIDKGYALDTDGKLIHRKVCRQAHGEFPKDWVVHHIDENKTNNQPDNLIALPRLLYDRLHRLMRRDNIKFNRAYCEQALKCWRGLKDKKNTIVSINLVTTALDKSYVTTITGAPTGVVQNAEGT